MGYSQLHKAVIGAGIALVISACAQAEGETEAADKNASASVVSVESDEAKASYGIGYSFALNLMAQTKGLNLNPDMVAQGVMDAMSEAERKVSEKDVQAAIMALQQKQMEVARNASKQAAQTTRAKGEAFQAENGKKEGVTITASGLQYEVIRRGQGSEHPTADSKVRVHYHGTLIDGTVFDSSVQRGEPIEFPLNGVINGWREGVQLMSPGDKFRFVIPADLAYGDSHTSPLIPPGSTLVFEVELLDIL